MQFYVTIEFRKITKVRNTFTPKVFSDFFSDEKPLSKFPDKAHIYV